MATTITGIEQTKVLSNLDTYNHTTMLNSMYVVRCIMSVIPPSGLSIVIQQNGSTKATSISPSAAENNIDLRIILNCAIGDVISVVLSSSSTSETAINQVKGILKITPGTI